MTGRVKESASASLKRRLAGLPAMAKTEADAALRLVGDEVVASARQVLAAGSSDPAGTLAASLSATVDAERSALAVTSSDPAAMFLEFGTRRMGARPFLRPAIAAVRAAALQHARDAMTRAARRFKEMA